MTVDSATGVLSPVQNFDTWGDPAASARLVSYLAGLPVGTIVLFAVADEASYQLSADARNAIALLFGSRSIRTLGYQQSWAMIGRTGSSSPLSEGVSTDTQVVLDLVLKIPAN